MAFAQGSRSTLSYITESTFGTTPAGNFQNLPFNTHSLNLTRDRVAGNEIQADRMTRVDRQGNSQVGGDIVVDLRDGDFDEFLESVMLNTWDTSPSSAPDVLKVGTTPKYFSIEDYAADIDQARLFTGCTVSTMGISMAPNQMITTTFGIIGSDMSMSATEKTQDASSSAQPFDAYSGDLAIGNVGSSSSAAIITSIDFTVNNSFSPTFVIGSSAAPSLEYGMSQVEGTFTAYFEDAALINRFLNETESELVITVNDPSAANEYEFMFPRIKVNSADVGVDGPLSRLITMSFVALYDSTEDTNFKISRPETA
jgi:hypothetical protein